MRSLITKTISVCLVIFGLVVVSILLLPNQKEDDLNEFYNTFLQIVQPYCKESKLFIPAKHSIIYGNAGSGNLAVCVKTPINWYIVVNQNYWQDLDTNAKYATMMHEFSHCVLGIPHSLDRYNYMYFAENGTKKVDVNNQLIENAKLYCEEK